MPVRCPSRPSLGQADGRSYPPPPSIDSRGEFPGWYPYAQHQWGQLEMPGQGRRHSVSADNNSGHTCTGLGGETSSRSGQPMQPHAESMEEDLQRELTEGKEGHGTAGRARRKWSNPLMSRDLPQTNDTRG